MSFSNTLVITEKSNIGRLLLKSHLSPDLNIGITFKSFNNSRKHPCSINKLKNNNRGRETTPKAIFKKEEDMPSGQKNELFFNKEIILLISRRLVGARKTHFKIFYRIFTATKIYFFC